MWLLTPIRVTGSQIASDWNKPDGQMCIGGDRAEVLRFLHDLPVRKVGGLGLRVDGVLCVQQGNIFSSGCWSVFQLKK